jgi:putative DNA primase/helicase
MFGYLIEPSNHLQKILMIIGPRRSGKGTIGRVLSRFLGDACARPSLTSLAVHFGAESLIGKSLAILADARLGKSADAVAAVERILSISGGDEPEIPRKNKTNYLGRLGAVSDSGERIAAAG